jgi:hypothetical protein
MERVMKGTVPFHLFVPKTAGSTSSVSNDPSSTSSKCFTVKLEKDAWGMVVNKWRGTTVGGVDVVRIRFPVRVVNVLFEGETWGVLRRGDLVTGYREKSWNKFTEIDGVTIEGRGKYECATDRFVREEVDEKLCQGGPLEIRVERSLTSVCTSCGDINSLMLKEDGSVVCTNKWCGVVEIENRPSVAECYGGAGGGFLASSTSIAPVIGNKRKNGEGGLSQRQNEVEKEVNREEGRDLQGFRRNVRIFCSNQYWSGSVGLMAIRTVLKVLEKKVFVGEKLDQLGRIAAYHAHDYFDGEKADSREMANKCGMHIRTAKEYLKIVLGVHAEVSLSHREALSAKVLQICQVVQVNPEMEIVAKNVVTNLKEKMIDTVTESSGVNTFAAAVISLACTLSANHAYNDVLSHIQKLNINVEIENMYDVYRLLHYHRVALLHGENAATVQELYNNAEIYRNRTHPFVGNEETESLRRLNDSVLIDHTLTIPVEDQFSESTVGAFHEPGEFDFCYFPFYEMS